MTDATPHPLVRSFLFLRRGVGLLGTALPLVLIVGNLLVEGALRDSISGYYHSPMRDVYVGTLCAVGVFLFFYRGYERSDRTASIIAGVCAIGAALFPASIGSIDVVGVLHVVFAGLMFLTFAYFCLVEFRKSGPAPPTVRKLQRNQVYVAMGVVILLCLALIALIAVTGLTGGLDEVRPVLWLEAIATAAFGVAWATKGEAILGDAHGPRERESGPLVT